MTKALEGIVDLVKRAISVWSSPTTLGAITTIVLTFLFVIWVTSGRRPKWKSLLTHDVATDAWWTIFYLGGFYAFFIGGPMYKVASALVARFVPWLRVSVLAGMNPFLHFLLLWLVIDLTGYWWHRLAHSSTLLWQFHRVHHSQVQLQPLTNYRFHFVDIALRTTMQFFPALLLGAPPRAFVAVALIEVCVDGLAHADASWSYGVIGKLVMNPAFHRIHHSADERHLGRNFGLSFTLWDRIFGTALSSSERPASYGVEGPMPRNFVSQIFFPFFAAIRVLRRQPPADAFPAASTPTPVIPVQHV
jgi:sterol desaturase/sphingolipid hydroxylase (fatty acid hydroxylase superfamily)